MARARWQDYVVVLPDVHHGEPCIAGTRVPVAIILGSLGDGMAVEEIRDAYPQLSMDDVLAALAYAAETASQELILLLPA